MNKLDEFFMEKIVKELDLKIYSGPWSVGFAHKDSKLGCA